LTSLAASVVDDDRFVLAVMIVAMIGIPRIARRFVPARPDGAARTAAPRSAPPGCRLPPVDDAVVSDLRRWRAARAWNASRS